MIRETWCDGCKWWWQKLPWWECVLGVQEFYGAVVYDMRISEYGTTQHIRQWNPYLIFLHIVTTKQIFRYVKCWFMFEHWLGVLHLTSNRYSVSLMCTARMGPWDIYWEMDRNLLEKSFQIERFGFFSRLSSEDV